MMHEEEYSWGGRQCVIIMQTVAGQGRVNVSAQKSLEWAQEVVLEMHKYREISQVDY